MFHNSRRWFHMIYEFLPISCRQDDPLFSGYMFLFFLGLKPSTK